MIDAEREEDVLPSQTIEIGEVDIIEISVITMLCINCRIQNIAAILAY